MCTAHIRFTALEGTNINISIISWGVPQGSMFGPISKCIAVVQIILWSAEISQRLWYFIKLVKILTNWDENK